MEKDCGRECYEPLKKLPCRSREDVTLLTVQSLRKHQGRSDPA